MNEQDVRALVREAIERHLGRPGRKGIGSLFRRTHRKRHPTPFLEHSSHVLLEGRPRQRDRRRDVRDRAGGAVQPLRVLPVVRTLAMARPSILVTYKLPSSAIAPLEAVGDVEVYRDGVLSHDELVRRVKGKQAVVVAALDKIDKDVDRRRERSEDRLRTSPSATTISTCRTRARRASCSPTRRTC